MILLSLSMSKNTPETKNTIKSKNNTLDALKYDKKTPREHVLIRPDTYIGDVEPSTEVMWVYNEDKIVKENITYTPGFLKIFDELIVNARDASVNDKTCDSIKIEYNIEEGYISVWNNGDNGIPIEEHPEHKMLVPTMIFGELLTSSNYNDDEERTTGGRNGYGSKCISIDTLVPLWTGEIKKACDLNLEDKLIGDNGKVRNIKQIINGNGKMYDIIQSSGEPYTVNDKHILTVQVPIHKVIFWNDDKNEWSVMWWEEMKINSKTFNAIDNDIKKCPECNMCITGNILRHYKIKHNGKQYKKIERIKPQTLSECILQAKENIIEFCKTIPDNNIFDISIEDYMKLNEITKKQLVGVRCECVQWDEKPIDIDPYILGMWLGDGINCEYNYVSYDDINEENTLNLDEEYSNLESKLFKYNLIDNKHIPKEYLINAKDIRLKVLAGIIDSDSEISEEKKCIIIKLINKRLSLDIIYLARSLGFYCNCNKTIVENDDKMISDDYIYGETYSINIYGNINEIPSKLQHKKDILAISKSISKSTGYINIKESVFTKYIGIEIDDNQRFLINDFTITHNCANIFSSKFIVEINDEKRRKHYIQEWTENMLIAHPPKITKQSSKIKSSVKVTFYPDFGRFKIKDLNNDHLKLFHRRAIDIAGVTDGKLKIFFNEKKVEANTFKSYVELYYKETDIYYDFDDRWSVACLYKPDAGGEVISFANGISTYRGGTHCNHVIDNIIKTLINVYIKKKDKDIKVTPSLLKDNFIFFINATIINPAFSSQTKDTLTTKIEKFGSKYEPTQAFLKKLAKCGIVEQIIQLIKFKENNNLKKTDGKKLAKITGIPKLEDANKSGTKESSKCTLILTEGDSAKAFAMAGLGIVGRDYYGIFPLKGKLLNVREATIKQLSDNEEINNLKQIVGFRLGVDYSIDANFTQLRYGRILILTDQDVDGSHIKGLFMNFVHCTWSSLLKRPNFITSLSTPIVKAFKGKDVKIFYNLTEYVDWKDSDASKGYKTKYYKGLGTSTSEEAKDYFVDIEDKLISYFWQNVQKELEDNQNDDKENNDEDGIEENNDEDNNKENNDDGEENNDEDDGEENNDEDDGEENNNKEKSNKVINHKNHVINHKNQVIKQPDEDAITLAFDKTRADDRKKWLMAYDRNEILKYTDKDVSYHDFIHFDLKHFSNDDNSRSIPSLVDGFKPSQRKIFYGASLRGLDKDEVKVSQLSGFVSDKAAYHHGEMSLNGAIIGMAQNFVGSNNINVLKPNGQFGCVDPDTDILIWDSSIKKAKDIIIGDILIGDDGKQRTVTKTVSGFDNMYKVKNGEMKDYIVNSSHILTVCVKLDDYNKISKFINSINDSLIFDINIQDYLKLPKDIKELVKGVVNSSVIEWKEQQLDTHPYLFGLNLCAIDTVILPHKYIFNSKYNRLELLAGVIDTNGYIENNNYIIVQNKKKINILESLRIVAGSLGFKTKIEKSENNIIKLLIIGYNLHEIPVKIERNQNLVKYDINSNNLFVHDIEIEKVDNGMYCGWYIDSNERFLLGDFTITHNTRLRGGKDAASPRYIWTKFEDLTSKIFIVDDEPILKKQDDDGLPIEPETYAPIIPMILINGTKGIGTGFSTTIPPFNPKDIIKSIRTKIEGKEILETLVPWWQGFTGKVIDNNNNEDVASYTLIGKWKIKENKLIITELPIGEWTSDYKEFLEKMLEDEPEKKDTKGKKIVKKEKKINPFKGYVDNNTDTKIRFELEFEDGYLDEIETIKLEKMFHLRKNVSINNMHLYNYNGTITRYDTVNDIIDEFYKVRLELYQKRKDYKLEHLKNQLNLISWKVKFILMIIEKKLEVNNKKKSDIEEKLVQHKFPKIDDSYNYLLSMPIYNLTLEKIEDLKKQEKEKQTEYDTLFGMKPQDLWINDLDVFEKTYDNFIQSKEEKESKNTPIKKIKKVKKDKK